MEFYKFRHPFTCMISGPTMSGKTVLVRRILEHYKELTTISGPMKVLWCYGQWQNLYRNIPNVEIEYMPGLPEETNCKILVLDDLMSELGDNKVFSDLFTKGSHHKGISVIYISQNLFHQGKVMRTIGLNCHYIILMKSIRGKSQLAILGRDAFPGKQKELMEAYEDATSKPFSYIRLDFTQQTPDKYRIISRLTPEENNKRLSPIVYLLK